MGLADRLVGVSHECNWPPQVRRLPRLTASHVDPAAPSDEIDRQVRERLRSGAPLYVIHVDLLQSARPELLLVQAQCNVCAVDQDELRATLANDAKLQSVEVLALSPTSLDEVLDDIQRIGAAAGASDEAALYATSLRSRLRQVRTTAGRIRASQRPRVVLLEWLDPLIAAGNWVPDMVRDAGGSYRLARAGEPSLAISWEQVVAESPELLLIAPCGFDLERARTEARILERLPGWRDLPAVRGGNAYVVDGDAYFNRAGPRNVDALEALAAAVSQAHGASAVDSDQSPSGLLASGWQRLR